MMKREHARLTAGALIRDRWSGISVKPSERPESALWSTCRFRQVLFRPIIEKDEIFYPGI